MNNPASLQHTLRALADPTRREILEILKNGAMPAGEIAEHFSITGGNFKAARETSSGKRDKIIGTQPNH